VEIVTEPDIHSAEQAKAYAKKIQQIVRTLQISTADMEKGSMRLEANISLSEDPNVLPNYKVEAKNINSFRFLEQAVQYEVTRQTEILDTGKTPAQETRGWSEAKHATLLQRSKEDAEDYRYFPDPDLPPMEFAQKDIDALRAQLPELPDDQQKRFEALGIKPAFALLLASAEHNTKTVDEAIRKAKLQNVEASVIANIIVNKKIDTNTISADEIVAKAKAEYSHDDISTEEIQQAAQKVIDAQPKAVADYKAGKVQVMGFLLGMVIRELKKKVDPKLVTSTMQKLLD
jgi:aspartyl-tRNA(Asn)/glutamyl-tRNA(Gln) amidotransferase subunit B